MRFILLILLTIILFIGNLYFGAVDIPMSEVSEILMGRGTDEALSYIVAESRMSQAITALLSGAGLAACGLMLQTAFRNPLAGPSILGITSGASLGVAIVMLLGVGSIGLGSWDFGGNAAITSAALTGSLAVMGILIFLSSRIRNNLMLLITGIMTGYLASALVSLLSSLSTSEGVREYVMWGMGTFGGVSFAEMPWFASLSIVGLVMAFLLAKPLDILLLGDNYARNLGIRIKYVRNMLLLATGILSAIITAYCGPIGFIGLAMPHIARLIFRTDSHLCLMPATMACGAITALSCNLISVIPENQIIPINALTPLIGVPVVLYVLLKKQR